MDKYLKHLPLVLISAFSIKLMIFGAAFPDAMCMLGLCALKIITHYVEHNKAKIIERDQLEDAQKLREEMAKEMVAFKSDVIQEISKAKMAAGLNTMVRK